MRLIELGLAGVCFSSVKALTVSATLTPEISQVRFCRVSVRELTCVGLLLLRLLGRFEKKSRRWRKIFETAHRSGMVVVGSIGYGRGAADRGRRLVHLHGRSAS